MKKLSFLPFFFLVILLVSSFDVSHAQINVSGVTGYTWNHTGNSLLKNHFAQTFNYVTFAWMDGTTVRIVVVDYSAETIYRFQDINLGSVDWITFGGLCIYNFTDNTVLISLTYRSGYNVYGCVIKYNGGSGDYTKYTSDSGFQPDAVIGTSQIIQASDGNFYFMHSGNRAGSYWIYIFKFTPAGVLSKVYGATSTYAGGYIYAIYDASVDSDNIYFVLASTYFYIYKYQISTATVYFVVAGSSPTDTLHLPTHQVIAKLFVDSKGAIHLIYCHAWYNNAPSSRTVEVHMNNFDLTNKTVNLFYVGGESYLGDAYAKGTYGIGVLTSTQVEFFAVNDDGDIFSFLYTLSGIPESPTVTNVVTQQISENVLTTALQYAYKYRGNYKVEITGGSQVWFGTKNLYMGYVAQYSATLLYPNSTNLEIYKTYKIGVEFLGDGIAIQNEPVVIDILYPDESKGTINMITDNNGVCDFYFAVYNRGLYYMTLKLHINGINVYNYSITWTGVGFGETYVPPSDTGEQINHAVAFLIPMAFLFIPALILAKPLGIAGLLSGITLGAICLWIAGYLPIWGIFLVGLILIFLIMSKVRAGGGETGE